MSITKRDIINGAFEELGLGEGYDATPEDYASALRRLDGMMAEWSSYGIQTGWPLVSQSSVSSIDDGVGLILPLREGAIASLAVRIAPAFGKTPSMDTKLAAVRGWNVAMRLASEPPQKLINTRVAPAGAGHKRRNTSQLLAPDGPHQITPEGKIIS